jgi:hypothetical protein
MRSCLVILIMLFCSQTAIAKEGLQLYEQEIKAGLLYNFLKYTNWPAASFDNDNKINLCVYGDDPFSGYLEPMQGRSVNQRIIRIRNIHAINEIENCQMLFVNENNKSEWPELRNYLSGQAILTVSDIKSFTKEGGIIEFANTGGHIAVKLNEDIAREAKLSVQDRLLKLVTIVHGGRK